jgi:hypothetical protein
MTRRIRLRRLLAAGLCATALTVSALAGIPATASAATPSVCTGNAYWGHPGNGLYCATPVLYTMPSGYLELFVIGLDHAVWTRWNSSSGVSRWVSLSGNCTNTGSPLGLGNISGYDNWTWYVNCTGGDGHPWWITRFGSASGAGTWTNWQSPPEWGPTLPTGTCSFGFWGGGGFCDTDATYTMPSGYQEIFMIGLDHAVWTRWNSSSGLSGWVSLGGYCANTGSPLGLGNVSGYDNWTWYVNCTGGDGAAWYRTRFGGSDGTGTWNGWTSTTP